MEAQLGKYSKWQPCGGPARLRRQSSVACVQSLLSSSCLPAVISHQQLGFEQLTQGLQLPASPKLNARSDRQCSYREHGPGTCAARKLGGHLGNLRHKASAGCHLPEAAVPCIADAPPALPLLAEICRQSAVRVRNLLRGWCTMRFGSTAKVPLKCKLKYYRISECGGDGEYW